MKNEKKIKICTIEYHGENGKNIKYKKFAPLSIMRKMQK
jgi:hypothetical protein